MATATRGAAATLLAHLLTSVRAQQSVLHLGNDASLVGDGGAAQRVAALGELKEVVEAANRYIDQLAADLTG